MQETVTLETVSLNLPRITSVLVAFMQQNCKQKCCRRQFEHEFVTIRKAEDQHKQAVNWVPPETVSILLSEESISTVATAC